jgi:hypothetical protein
MPMHLPDLGETHCISMRLCGTIQTRSKKTIEFLHNPRDPILANYERNGRQVWVYVEFGGGYTEFKTTHFHIELFSRLEYKPSVARLKPVGENDLQAAVQQMLGKRIDVSVAGYFSISNRDVNEHSLAYELVSAYKRDRKKKSAGVMVRTDFEITRGPIRNIGLHFSADKQSVLVELSAKLLGKITDDYLQTFLGILEFSFLLHVRGELPDVSGQPILQ